MGSRHVQRALLAVFVLLLLGCGVEDSSATTAPTMPTRGQREVSLSLYVVRIDSEDGATGLSSDRTVEEVELIAERVNEIWAQADIVFSPVTVRELSFPADVLEVIVVSGDTDPFFEQAGMTFEVPDTGAVNGFYVSRAFGVNGFTPLRSRVFFVVDNPSVLDERVSSHELGHIFGLHHALDDAERLMFSGTNGMILTDQEQEVARYGVEGIIGDGSR